MIEDLDKIHEGTKHRIKDNEKAVVYQAVFLNSGITRKKIVDKIGVRPTIVSMLITELIDQGLVTEGAILNNGKKGRPEILLHPNFDLFVCISIYVVSNQMKGVLLNLNDQIIADSSILVPSNVDNGSMLNIIRDIVWSLERKIPSGSQLLGVGISFPGNINLMSNELVFSIRWSKLKNFSFDRLSDYIGHKILVSTGFEAKLEYYLFKHPEYRKGGILLYHWGYGIGASYAYNGRIMKSTLGFIMEIGHISLNYDSTKLCRCGNTGCIETTAALWSLIPDLQEADIPAPEDEQEFSRYLQDNNLSDNDLIKNAGKTAVHGLLILYQLLFPDRILLFSPFLTDEHIFRRFKEDFFTKISTYTKDKVLLEKLPLEFQGEIFGSTHRIFRERLGNELIVRY
jgi:predicted NBD/HSP70 family sugar kinase